MTNCGWDLREIFGQRTCPGGRVPGAPSTIGHWKLVIGHSI